MLFNFERKASYKIIQQKKILNNNYDHELLLKHHLMI